LKSQIWSMTSEKLLISGRRKDFPDSLDQVIEYLPSK
jgi:hypothetical protein